MASLTKDEKKDDTEEWKRKIEEEQNFEVKQITLVEILPDRSGPAVISGLSRMHARLRYLGLPLLRLHSDRAGRTSIQDDQKMGRRSEDLPDLHRWRFLQVQWKG